MKAIIVGAGFTGTMIAVHLGRESRPPSQIVLIERSGRFGSGVAYSTRHAAHLLNVPACQMSAFADDDGHFLRWAKHRDPSIRDGDFLPRQVFGEYLRGVLEQAKSEAPRGVAIECIEGEATALHTDAAGGVVIRLADGRSITGDSCVLAIGNYPPADPPCKTPAFYRSKLYQRDPWAADALDVDARADLLLIGTGLTMIDVVIALDQAGHTGAIRCISRRGLVPQSHRDLAAAPVQLPVPSSLDDWPRTALGLLRGLRAEIVRNGPRAIEWRDIVSSMRPVTASLWSALSREERRRFLGHLRPFWETHRHRAAPAIGRTIQRLRDTGRLDVIAGRVLEYDVRNDTALATIRRRGSSSNEVVSASRVINCTGPDTDLARVQEPFVQSLRQAGVVTPDELGLGLATDPAGRLLDRDGRAHRSLFLAGPLLRGRLWENTAVPELRSDALRCARRVIENA